MLYLTRIIISRVVTRYPMLNIWVSGDCAISERWSMVCAPVRRDNPRALARGLSTVQAHKPCSISLVP